MRRRPALNACRRPACYALGAPLVPIAQRGPPKEVRGARGRLTKPQGWRRRRPDSGRRTRSSFVSPPSVLRLGCGSPGLRRGMRDDVVRVEASVGTRLSLVASTDTLPSPLSGFDSLSTRWDRRRFGLPPIASRAAPGSMAVTLNAPEGAPMLARCLRAVARRTSVVLRVSKPIATATLGSNALERARD